MGEKFHKFRLHTMPRWARTIITLAYFVWATAFIIIGFQPANSDAASGDTLSIPSISLETTTEPVALVDRRFSVPDFAVGAYYASENKIFLMGHKATIFSELKDVALGDEITFADDTYSVTNIEVKPKDKIDMSKILASTSEPTLILMTCHGTPLSDTDYSHRLILTATSS